MIKLERMSVKEYKKWLKDKRRFDASTDSFHRNGFERTLNVLEGDAQEKSFSKWRSFKARWTPNLNDGATYKEHIAVRNWGLKPVRNGKKIPIPPKK